MFTRLNCWTTLPFDISFCFKLFLVYYYITWEYSDPNCSSQGVFTSSAFQILTSRSCSNNWSLCWYICRTSDCYLLDVCGEWTLEYLSLLYSAALTIPYILCGVSVGTLTVISVDRLIALLLGLRYRGVVTMGFACCLFSNVVLGSSYKLLVCHHLYHTVSYNPCFLVHKDFPHPPSSSNSSTRPCSTTRNQTNELNIARYKKAVFSAIWLQLTLVACYLPHGVAAALVANSGLISSVYLAGIYYNHSSLLKLVV